jgi:hypothetical protein
VFLEVFLDDRLHSSVRMDKNDIIHTHESVLAS